MSMINWTDLSVRVVQAAQVMAEADGFNISDFSNAPIAQPYYKRAVALEKSGLLK